MTDCIKPTAEDLARDLPDMLERAEFAESQMILIGLGAPEMATDLVVALRRAIFAEAERDKLQAFKDWVHGFLDKHDVPHHPPGTHGAAGCRIGDRMDWLMAEVSQLRRLKTPPPALDAATTVTLPPTIKAEYLSVAGAERMRHLLDDDGHPAFAGVEMPDASPAVLLSPGLHELANMMEGDKL